MDLLTILLALVVGGLLYYYFHKRLSHFETLGVLHEKPLPLLGNLGPVFLRRYNLFEYLQALYYKFSQARYFGFYNFMTPIIVIRDPELIATIGVKNFDDFCDHRSLGNEKVDPLMAKNLFSLCGDNWRNMRKVLSPTFTSSKMKMMYGLVCECAENFVGQLANQAKGGKAINTKEMFGRYTNDVVATCAFGVDVDSMRQPKNQFYVLGREATNLESVLGFKLFLGKIFLALSKLLGWRMISKRVSDFFFGIISETVKARDEKGIYRPDMIQLMMESKGENNQRNLTVEQMTAQAFIFFFGGFDTSSTFMSFVAHVLAVHPQVQKKLKAEIADVLKQSDGKPSYEAITQMKYLDAVASETLRLYPQLNFLDRVCVNDFQLPEAFPGAKPVTVKSGDTVWFPSYSLHRDPQYFPEPEKFDPERFLNGQIDQSVYMPFGVGPRHCIGNRFALMQAKVVIFYLLCHCDLEPCDRTTVPMVFGKKFFQMMPQNGFWLTVRARDSSLMPTNRT